jgi:hypothetical protein
VLAGFWGGGQGKATTWETGRVWEDNIKMDFEEVGWGHGLD